MTIEDKINQGLIMGNYANKHINESDAEIGIVLCDDDQLHPDYLAKLSDYFEDNPSVNYCYSFINVINPLLQKTVSDNIQQNKYNNHGSSINPVGKLDVSQVAWRLQRCKEDAIWFPETTKIDPNKPWVNDTDKNFFSKLYQQYGECKQTGFLGQFKGIHDYQLVWHKNTDKNGLRSYDKMIGNLAGVKF